jgi:putative FmdB family regulatory protein
LEDTSRPCRDVRKQLFETTGRDARLAGNTLMPLYSFHCRKCDKESEVLAGFNETPGCPRCGNTRMVRLPSRPAPPLTYKSYVRKMRAQAVKEGDASNFSRAERAKFKA